MTPHTLTRPWLPAALVAGVLLATLLGACGGTATNSSTKKPILPGITLLTYTGGVARIPWPGPRVVNASLRRVSLVCKSGRHKGLADCSSVGRIVGTIVGIVGGDCLHVPAELNR